MKYALFVLSFVATQVFATGSNHHNVYDNSVVNRGGNAVSDSYSSQHLEHTVDLPPIVMHHLIAHQKVVIQIAMLIMVETL